LKRRTVLALGLLGIPLRGIAQANAHVSTTDPLVYALTKGKVVNAGRVKLELPKIADTGYSVPMTVRVESPMTPANYVRALHLIAEKNPIRDMASYQGKLLGIPYRVTASILHYQKPLLAEVGFAKAPESWDEFLKALVATTKAGAPNRYGLGIWGRQGPAMTGGFVPFLRGNGGRYFDPKTWEIDINKPDAVEALQFYGDLMTKYKVVVPDAISRG